MNMSKQLLPRILVVICASALLLACGVNPVTGKKELQFISQSQEIAIGQEAYAPSRQTQGGDYQIDPELTRYVAEVGSKLGAVSDRQLPYEFVVLNNSVPNAWAMPGGKIAVNRGLLTELHSEAELAAVLGHEITHAAARHGAKAQERGMFLQGALLGLQLGVRDNQYSNLILGGAMLGANLVTMRYGREAELEADHYGMAYMKRAGYDPAAAVDLQQTFVKLSSGKKSGWLDGMFASHPPSEERVARNQATLAELGAGGDVAADRFDRALANLRKAAPAYKKYDEGVAALAGKDTAKALALATEAAKLEPREGKFYELMGDAELARDNLPTAATHYNRAAELNPGYFKPYLQRGVVSFRRGDKAAAAAQFERSMQLLPTAVGSYYLGKLAQDGGNTDAAIKYYQLAAQSDSDVGKESQKQLVLLDLPRNPGNYLRVEPQLSQQGAVILIVENRSPVAIKDLALAAALVDASGRVAVGPQRWDLGGQVLQSGQAVQIATSFGPFTDPNVLAAVRVEIQRAAAAE
jgi:beta-barrel assembly-enhancing protease